jgi:hypothetical protein
MTIMQWLSESIGEVRESIRPIRREFVPVFQERRIDVRRKKAFYVALIALAIFTYGLPLAAWTEDLSTLAPTKLRKVVAAGVGYENAATSTITVKTYDAETGAMKRMS